MTEYGILQIETHFQIGPLFPDFTLSPRRGTSSVDRPRSLLPLGRFPFVGEAGAVAD